MHMMELRGTHKSIAWNEKKKQKNIGLLCKLCEKHNKKMSNVWREASFFSMKAIPSIVNLHNQRWTSQRTKNTTLIPEKKIAVKVLIIADALLLSFCSCLYASQFY